MRFNWRKASTALAVGLTGAVMLSGVAGATGHKFTAELASLKDWIKLDAFLDKPVTGRQLLKVIEDKLGLPTPSLAAG